MIEVLRPGLLTTVQDTGRAGFRAQGVPPGGALDGRALRLANLLVGNPEDAAGLEITLLGPRLHFGVDTRFALTGAELEARLDGEPVPSRRPLRAGAGSTLDLGAARAGCRAYLACAGGIDVPVLLGSRATCLPGRFGGMEGRPLRAGDRLPLGEPAGSHPRRAPWSLSRDLQPLPGPGAEIRLLPGAHSQLLTPEARERLRGEPFRLSPASDRMGCRLEGPPLSLSRALEPSSEGVVPGTVQLPPGGEPIVLLADAGTTGGYPRIGHVADVDLRLLAQLRPGDSLRFRETTLSDAHRLLRREARTLAFAAHAIRLHSR